MNAHPQPRLVRVRRANKVTAIGKHYTLTAVTNTPRKQFAFAISDDGQEEIYIPAPVVRREQMTQADIGAGFTCTTRRPDGYDSNAPHPHARLPIWWDGAAETLSSDQIPGMETDVPEPDPEFEKLQQDMDELGNAVDQLVQLEGAVDTMRADIDATIATLMHIKDSLGGITGQMKTVRTILDRVCPELEN